MSTVQKKGGWKCRYVQQYCAIGEAPEEVRNAFQQRSRWCKGHFQTFWSPQCPLFDRRLGIFFRLTYSSTCLSYISAGACLYFCFLFSGGFTLVSLDFWCRHPEKCNDYFVFFCSLPGMADCNPGRLLLADSAFWPGKVAHSMCLFGCRSFVCVGSWLQCSANRSLTTELMTLGSKIVLLVLLMLLVLPWLRVSMRCTPRCFKRSASHAASAAMTTEQAHALCTTQYAHALTEHVH